MYAHNAPVRFVGGAQHEETEMRHYIKSALSTGMLATGVLAAGVLVAGSMVMSASADTIKIGFNVPLTGFAAADGQSALHGAELGVGQVNAAGGINGEMLELVVYDDQASPKEAAPLAVKMITQDEIVAGVSGSYSGATRAAATIFAESKVPYISAYAIHPDITRAGDYVFRTSFMGEVQGRAGAKLIGEMLGEKRVAMVTLNNDFGKSLATGFKEQAGNFGIEIVAEYEYSIKDREFGPIISKIKADKPDAIYASGYFFTAGPMVSQIRAAGLDQPVVGQEGYDSQKFIEIAGGASEGVLITTSLDRDSSAAETKDFIKGFAAKAGYPADMVAASAHTAILVLADALKKSGSGDKAALRDAVAKTDLTASTGHISFNALGEVQKDVQVQIVKNGNWHHHSVISDAVLLAPPAQ
jgi:branched-chain amino acid transport system substrate-binding protein